MDLLAYSHTDQCHHYYTLENLVPSRALRLSAYNQDWKYQVSYLFPPSALISEVPSQVSGRTCTGQFTGTVANEWKTSTIIPFIEKPNISEEFKNYQPVNDLCIIFKYIEKAMLE